MRRCWLFAPLALAACAIPERDNPSDPVNRAPIATARLRLADATDPAPGQDGEGLPVSSAA